MSSELFRRIIGSSDNAPPQANVITTRPIEMLVIRSGLVVGKTFLHIDERRERLYTDTDTDTVQGSQ